VRGKEVLETPVDLKLTAREKKTAFCTLHEEAFIEIQQY